MSPLSLMMSDASKVAFGDEAILPIFSSQKIPTVAHVMTSPSFVDSSRFSITSSGVLMFIITTFIVLDVLLRILVLPHHHLVFPHHRCK